MKKCLTASILAAEAAAFGMLLLLFFLNTNKPYLLMIPVVGVIGSYMVFVALLRKRKAVPLLITLPLLSGALIAVLVIGLLSILSI
ncbi:MAG: hypothetical protein FWE66_04100 [Oscillospiraceae bacterium]|nr:hypothetical protein [Oscillospiraceae bacterium]